MQSRNAGTNEFTLQPGEAFSLAVHAEYVLIEKASGPVHLSVDEGGRQELTAGFAYYAAGANGFSKLELLNDGAGAITVRIQYGWGELKDTRLTVSGVVDIAQTETLEVRETAPRWKTSDGGAVVEMGAERWSGSVTDNLTIISAAENVNGVIIRTAVCYCNSGHGCGIYAEGPYTPYFLAQNGLGASSLNNAMYINPGVGLKAWGSGAGAFVYLTWDVL